MTRRTRSETPAEPNEGDRYEPNFPPPRVPGRRRGRDFVARKLRAGSGRPLQPYPPPYAPEANEPHIDPQTMSLHHGRHHQAMVTNLNAALKDRPQVAAMGVAGMLGKLSELPEAIRGPMRNNAGGHANHSMFWQVMGGKGGAPTGDVAAAIDRDLVVSTNCGRGSTARPDTVRLGLGVRDRQPRGQARYRVAPEPGLAADGRHAGAVRQ